MKQAKTMFCWNSKSVFRVREIVCREKAAKLKEAKAAQTAKSAGAKRLERAFQALHENSVQLVRLALMETLTLTLILSHMAAKQGRGATITYPPALPPGAFMLQPQVAIQQATVVLYQRSC